jgi:hypothetical protein
MSALTVPNNLVGDFDRRAPQQHLCLHLQRVGQSRGIRVSSTYRLYLNLEQLMEASAARRLGMESPASES